MFEWVHDPSHGSSENAYYAWLRAKHPVHWERAETERVTRQNTEYKHGATAFDSMPTEAHYTTWVAERAAAFLESADDRPFLVLGNSSTPTTPLSRPKGTLTRIRRGSIPPPKGLTEDFARKPDWQQMASRACYPAMALRSQTSLLKRLTASEGAITPWLPWLMMLSQQSLRRCKSRTKNQILW